jgi:hypothetical protein
VLDAKAKKWLHPGLGGSPVKSGRAGPSRAELLATYRSRLDAAGWTLGLPGAGALRPLQKRVLDFLTGPEASPGSWDADLEAGMVAMTTNTARDAVGVWVREAGLGFALEALWRKTWLIYDFHYATPTSSYSLKDMEKNFIGAPDDAWWALRRLAALASPEDRARAVVVGRRLLKEGGPTLDGLLALVLPEPDWVERAVRETGSWWMWSLVLCTQQAAAVQRRHADSSAARFLLSWHVADLVDRLGDAAAPLLAQLLAGLVKDVFSSGRGGHDIDLAVKRVAHVLGLIDTDEARAALDQVRKSAPEHARHLLGAS